MKHIFIIHSNISYLASLGVICKERIPNKNVIFIAKKYSNEWGPIPIHNIGIRTMKDLFRHPIDVLAPIYSIDKHINKLCENEKYIAYVDAVTSLQQIIITNKNCVNFHYIEEGLSVYREKIYFQSLFEQFSKERSFRNNKIRYILSDIIAILKGFSLKMQALPYIYNACFNCIDKKFYGFSENSFYRANNLEIISLKQVKDSFNWTKKYDLDNCHIWLGLSFTESDGIRMDSYIDAIRNGCINKLIDDNINKIFVKFHPVESEESKKCTMELFETYNINVEILPNNLFLEIELLLTQNVTLWSVDTSIFLYAADMGHQCN